MNPKNHWVNNFCFNFCLLFLLYLKLPSWNLRFSEFCYLPNSIMKRDGCGISSKPPDWKPLFLLTINIKHNPGCPNEEHDEVFKHFHKNIMVYPRSKENLHWPVIGKALRVGKNLSNARCWWISLVCSKCSWWASGGNRDARKNVQFFPSFKLRNSIFRTLSDTKLLFKYKHFFYLKTGSLILNCVSLSVPQTCFKNCALKTILTI